MYTFVTAFVELSLFLDRYLTNACAVQRVF